MVSKEKKGNISCALHSLANKNEESRSFNSEPDLTSIVQFL